MIARLRYWFRSAFGARHADRATLDELAFHTDMQAQRLVAQGVDPADARRQAALQVGDPTRVLQRVRDERGGWGLAGLILDLRSALRVFRRSPGFTAAVVLTVGLGLGAVISVYSLIDAVLLRPSAYRDSGELINLAVTNERWRNAPGFSTFWDKLDAGYPGFLRMRASARTLSNVAAFAVDEMALTGVGPAAEVRVGSATASLMATLGVSMATGRWFAADEEGAAAPPLVVLSHGIWQTRFGGDPQVVGRVIDLDEVPFAIIGVLPPGFRLGTTNASGRESATPALWVPLGTTGRLLEGDLNWELIGRLAPGATMAQAEAEVAPLVRPAGPEVSASAAAFGVRAVPRREAELSAARRPLALTFGVVSMVLLIACANVAALLLGSATAREGEMRTRAALGASPARLVRQLLTECVLLALSGALIGVFLAWAATRAFAMTALPVLPAGTTVTLNLSIIGFSVGAALVTAVLFGLTPALWLVRVAATSGELGRSVRGARQQRGLQGMMLAGQVALALALMTGTGLLLRSLSRELSVDPGFQAGGLMVASLSPPLSRRTGDRDQRGAYHARLLAAARELPGVRDAALSSAPPFNGSTSAWGVTRIDEPRPSEGGTARYVNREVVTPGYFGVLGVPLVAGRQLTSADAGVGAEVPVVINARMAEMIWPGEAALGRQLRIPDDRIATVVGVVADYRSRGLDLAADPTLYWVGGGDEPSDHWIVVAVGGAPAERREDLRRALWAVDPLLVINTVETIDGLINTAMATDRYRLTLIGLCAVAALVLAGTGIGGVVSFAVRQRRREVGVRVALGASPASVVAAMQAQIVWPLAFGLLAGLGAAVALSRFLRSALFNLSPFDPPAFLAAVGLLVLAAWAASYIPARRAAQTDPMQVLRTE